MPRKHVKYQNRLKKPGKDIYFGLHVDFNYMYVWFVCLFVFVLVTLYKYSSQNIFKIVFVKLGKREVMHQGTLFAVNIVLLMTNYNIKSLRLISDSFFAFAIRIFGDFFSFIT